MLFSAKLIVIFWVLSYNERLRSGRTIDWMENYLRWLWQRLIVEGFWARLCGLNKWEYEFDCEGMKQTVQHIATAESAINEHWDGRTMKSDLSKVWKKKWLGTWVIVWGIDEWSQRLRGLPPDLDHCVTIAWVWAIEYGWVNGNRG